MRCRRGSCWLIANEFLDALRSPAGARPHRVGRAARGARRGRPAGLRRGSENLAFDVAGSPALRAQPAGTIVEICPAAAALAAALGERLATRPGAALFVDTAISERGRLTLAALRRHAAAGMLDDPGSAEP